MFAKPLNLILVYIVTVFNVIILASPVLAVAVPFMDFSDNSLTIDYNLYYKIKTAFIFLAFAVSFLMLAYFFLDFLFGFSVRSSLKNCTRHEKLKDYDFLSDVFDQVKNKFDEKYVRLYVKNSDEINAFAVSSLGGKAIVLTRGLINHYLIECSDPKKFLYALRSIIAHEMSHLVNKDFLPTFLIIANQKVTNFISNILRLAFNFIAEVLRVLPYGGNAMYNAMHNVHTILNVVINSFNRFVVFNFYEFLRRFVSRSIEYRCDRQAAKAFGGQNMSFALSMLGESGYFTLFSTHPRTIKRMEKVREIELSDSVIRPSFIDSLSNYLAFMFLMVICLYFAKQAHVDLMLREYIRDHHAIHRKLSMLLHLVTKFF